MLAKYYPNKIYVPNGKGVTEYAVVEETEDEYRCVPAWHKTENVKKKNSANIFKNKKEAMYENFKNSRSDHTKFKGSKYYSYYIERARKEDPDRLI